MTTNGGSAKPCLNYSSRSEAIRVLRGEGLSNSDIAAKTGIPLTSICALVPMKPKAVSAPVPKSAGFKTGSLNTTTIGLNFEVRLKLRPFAAKRCMAVDMLITELVERIAEDGLVDAVMDDGAE